jgi:putative flavoprotein involved in K+ transport
VTSDLPPHCDTVVIGSGQAGLAMGYYLGKHDRDFVIIDESERVGDTWRNRWDSLRLFTQAQYSSLPGLSFPAPDTAYPTKDEVADYLEAYADRFDLPVRLNTRVTTLSRNSDQYMIETGDQRVAADHVVVATGPFHHPTIPAFADQLSPSVTQCHSSKYRTPEQLPAGDILVVGAGNSGTEIAVDVAATDRQVWLAGRDTGYVPPIILNNRVFRWVVDTVLTVDTWPGQKLKERTHDRGDPVVRLSSRDIRRAGIERGPRMDGVVNGLPRLADERVLNVDAVIWATGFHPNFEWIDVPIFGADGYPRHYRGVVDDVPGLYFLGLPFLYSIISTDIGRVGRDARYITDHLTSDSHSQTVTEPTQADESIGKVS